MIRWMAIVALAVTVGACAEPGGSRDGTTPALDETARQALEAELVEADRTFARAATRAELGAWMESIAPTGRLISGGESHLGQEGVRRAMLPLYADSTYTLSWDPNYAEVAASEDLGYTVGRYEAKWKEDGVERTSGGTYLTVWRRQPNGRWKIQANIGNPDADD